MGELKKLKIEKTVRVERVNRSLNRSPFDVTYKLIDIKDRHHPGLQEADKWLFPSDFALSFSLLADLGILGNVGTSLNIRSNS